ncbi:MAG: hypothetical protein JJU34_06735 [Lunatimonas sp.]|uniref:hypothetical protein n=1 Tax=Lunatimonas sp. TaxID=2060141 RepID=UPI00263BC0A8|nr:hypothetical protein [Lunatimonas sp.]MCC5936959.1 hypothetical protein [Lunatimonas sp.]
MEKATLYLLVGCFLLVSSGCGSNRMQTEEVVTYTEPYQPQGCFVYESGVSKAFLEVQFTGDVVQGRLRYALEGKDENRGTMLGKLSGDRITAVYTFASEGQTSTREVVFRVRGDGWVEGFGTVEVEDNRAFFTDPASIDFSEGLSFTPVVCSEASF